MVSEQAYALCMAIEELPASEKQTQISVMAADLRAKVAEVEGELAAKDKTIARLKRSISYCCTMRNSLRNARAEAAEAKCRELEARLAGREAADAELAEKAKEMGK